MNLPDPRRLPRILAILLASAMAVSLAIGLPAQNAAFQVTNLGQVPGQWALAGVGANDISADGTKIAGTSVWEAYVWDAATGMRALPKPPGESVVGATGVLDSGVAVGTAGLAAPAYRALHWDPAGAITSLHQPGWMWSRSVAMNETGQILVTAAVPRAGSGTGTPHVYLGDLAGNFVDLAPAVTSNASGIALNPRGDVVYYSDTQYFMLPAGAAAPIALGFTAPHALSEVGEIGGIANGTVWRYTLGLGWQALPRPANLTFAHLGGINSFGQIVASDRVRTSVSPPRYAYTAHLYTDGIGWTELNTVVDQGLPTDVKFTAGITDEGLIAADGSYGPDNRALHLKPRFVTTFGAGCPGSGGVSPKALVAGDPRGGSMIAFLGACASPGSAGAMLLSLGTGSIPLPGGCTAFVDPALMVVVPVTASPAGRVSIPVGIPAGITPTSVWAQFGTFDAGAANGAFAMSNGVRLDVR